MDPDMLANQFMTMGTAEHSSLVNRFKQIVPGTDEGTAKFFLEANHWNLQNAISSFYDSGGTPGLQTFQQQGTPNAELVCDVTIGEGEEIAPNMTFDKTWRLRNNGDIPWPRNSFLHHTRGEPFGTSRIIPAPELAPGEVIDVTLRMKSPSKPGTYASAWRLLCDAGFRFYYGNEIWVVITIAEGGTMSLTQQMHYTTMENQHMKSSVAWRRPSVMPPPQSTMMAQPPPQQQQQLPPQQFSFGSLSSHTFGSSVNAFGTSMEDDTTMQDDPS